MSVTVVIPARSGSKGILGKNLVDLDGKHLIEHTFETVLKLKNIDNIILSTDDQKIIQLAKRYKKISIPFVRPKELSSDTASMVSVILHLLSNLESKFFPEYVVLLQPTSPFRKSSELNEMIDFTIKNNFNSVVAVTKVWHHPSEYLYMQGEKIKHILDPEENTRRQDFKDVYFITGAAYVVKTSFIIEKEKFINADSKIFELSESSMIDIDSSFHLDIARGYSLIKK